MLDLEEFTLQEALLSGELLLLLLLLLLVLVLLLLFVIVSESKIIFWTKLGPQH